MTEKTKKRIKTAFKVILGAAVVGGAGYVAYKKVPVFRNGVNKCFGKVSGCWSGKCNRPSEVNITPKYTTRPVHVDTNGIVKTR